MIPPEESCGYGESNKLSASCGNCNYGLGSYCEAYERGKYPGVTKPNYGNNICSDLGCRDGTFADSFKEENGRYPVHGESWCLTSNYEFFDYSEINQFSPGEESYVMRCSNGEVNPESGSTGEWRQKVCREEVDANSGVHYANPVLNTWMDCLKQTTEEDCNNLQERDCVWLEGHSIYQDEEGVSLSLDENENPIEATCIAKFSPAFDFWNSETSSSDICSLGSKDCVVTFQLNAGINARDFGTWSLRTKLRACTDNCYCLKGYEKGMETHRKFDQDKAPFDSYDDWVKTMNNVCWSLGDCGSELNYIGEEGAYNFEDDIMDSEYFRKRQEFEDWANSQ